MEPEGSLLFSQQPANGTYLEIDECSPHPNILIKVNFNIILPSTLRFSK